MPLEVTHDNILIKRDPFEERSAGGLFLATANQQGLAPNDPRRKNPVATVIEVGPGALTDDGNLKPVCCAKGDRILVSVFGGDPIRYRGEDYEMIKDEHVKARIVQDEGWVEFSMNHNGTVKAIKGGDDWYDYVEARSGAVGIPRAEMLIQLLESRANEWATEFGHAEHHTGVTLKTFASNNSLDLEIK